MIDNNIVTSLQQNFCVFQFDEHGTQITIPLKENGFHIMVNSTNRDEYIALLYISLDKGSNIIAPQVSSK